ncbi:MAG TPA: hypothetical protein VL244_12370 [Alphaproteobacteria bacterium]|nr:hypothetical protein [Alphaproteobacteria bacterium]
MAADGVGIEVPGSAATGSAPLVRSTTRITGMATASGGGDPCHAISVARIAPWQNAEANQPRGWIAAARAGIALLPSACRR